MRRRRAAGSSSVEGALVLLVFLVVLLGIADFAQVFLMHNVLTERARSAARAGAVNGCTDEEMVKIVLHGDRAGSGRGTFGLTPENVIVARDGVEASRRVSVSVAGLSYPVFSPLIAGRLMNLPVHVVVSSEAP